MLIKREEWNRHHEEDNIVMAYQRVTDEELEISQKNLLPLVKNRLWYHWELVCIRNPYWLRRQNHKNHSGAEESENFLLFVDIVWLPVWGRLCKFQNIMCQKVFNWLRDLARAFKWVTVSPREAQNDSEQLCGFAVHFLPMSPSKPVRDCIYFWFSLLI